MNCACGYDRDYHAEDGHCPLCACGDVPAEHRPVAVPPAPEWVEKMGKIEWRCPGKDTTLRRGSFREPPAPAAMRGRADGSFVPAPPPVDPDEPEIGPPRVPARLTVSTAEIARSAGPLGSLAADLGWAVVPWYYVAADGTETSVLVMRRDALRAVAYWHRTPGGTWRTGGCRAWRLGEWPQAIGVKALTSAIEQMG